MNCPRRNRCRSSFRVRSETYGRGEGFEL